MTFFIATSKDTLLYVSYKEQKENRSGEICWLLPTVMAYVASLSKQVS